MAWQQPGFVISLQAAKDLSSYQWELVALTTAAKVTTVTSAAAIKLGILQNNPTSGKEASIMLSGVSKVKAGGAFSTGQSVKTNGASTTNGGAVIAATSSTKGHNLGYSLQASAQAGDIVPMIIGSLLSQE